MLSFFPQNPALGVLVLWLSPRIVASFGPFKFSGVQQGDPLGPMLFALVLQKLISTIDADDECLQLLLQAWYLDDGVLAGKRSAVLHALNLIEELGPHIGLVINFSKCKVFSPPRQPFVSTCCEVISFA